MATYEELVAKEQAIRAILAAGAEEKLRAIPGVIHVGVGLKEQAGVVTDQHCIRVTVMAKVPEGKLNPAERIPREIDGVPTDVIIVDTYQFSIDNGRYRPIKGGIQITNRIIDTNDAMTRAVIERGTLGCIATRTADKSQVLLSNWHVLMANSARHGDRIYQPSPAGIPPVSLADLPLRPNEKYDAIAEIVDHAITAAVDCAIARIDVSSWCRCCGIDYRNEVNGISVGGHPPSNLIVGQRAAVSGMTVYKVGMMTGRTVGRVVMTHSPDFTITKRGVGYTFSGQMQIESSDPAAPFSRHGDSGSVIIDEQGFIVGLLFGDNNQNPPAGRTVANHIADVCSALGITINVTPSSTQAGTLVAVPEAFVPAPEAEAYRRLRVRLERDPQGRKLLDIIERHRIEAVNLVTGKRPVTVAWHRSGGPAFLAIALATLREGGEDLPPPIHDVPFAEALERTGAALAAFGSPGLRSSIEAYGPQLVAAVRESSTISELIERLGRVPLSFEELAAGRKKRPASHGAPRASADR
jgi:hypothetical protein